MSELTEFFGERDEQPVTVTKRTTWHCEPTLIPLLDGYLEWVRQEVGSFEPPNWYSAARTLREELYRYHVPESEWKAFVLWACKQMKKKELFNKDHRSIVWLVPGWQTRKRDPESDRNKYLKWSE